MDVDKMTKILDKEDKDPDTDIDITDEDGDYIEEDSFFTKNKSILIIIGCVVLVVLAIVVFVVLKPKPEPLPPAPPPVEVEVPDPWLEAQRELYEQGIGNLFIDEAHIYQQGNIDTFTFREDFSQVDQPEIFVLPIKIDVASDSMSYTKHRSVTSPGIEIYWLEGVFRNRNVVTTIPYSLYQQIPSTGVISVEVEVVTDANKSITITHMRPLPPTKIKGGG